MRSASVPRVSVSDGPDHTQRGSGPVPRRQRQEGTRIPAGLVTTPCWRCHAGSGKHQRRPRQAITRPTPIPGTYGRVRAAGYRRVCDLATHGFGMMGAWGIRVTDPAVGPRPSGTLDRAEANGERGTRTIPRDHLVDSATRPDPQKVTTPSEHQLWTPPWTAAGSRPADPLEGDHENCATPKSTMR